MKALDAAADVLREAERDSRESPPCPDKPREPYVAHNADALALMAETYLAHDAAALAAGDRHS
jgi:hypothetical protein